MTIKTDIKPTYNEIHAACVKMATDIKVYGYKIDRILGVTRGGLLPALILSHMLEIPVTAIDYSSKSGKGDNKNHSNILPDVKEQAILVIDDIADSGKTLFEISQHYTTQLKNVYTGVLFYKNHESPVLVPDFRWKVIPEDAGWVIFPFEVPNALE